MLPKKDDRVRLVHMGADPDPIPSGTEGTVIDVQELRLGPGHKTEHQILVKWDNGRSLSCICPPDIVQVIEPVLTTGSIDH